jgi:hypothetical protein
MRLHRDALALVALGHSVLHGGMITFDLARDLAAAGMPWMPSSGDRFVIPGKEMDEEVFHVAEMTIEVASHHGEGVVKFNGTTEWALDSIPSDSVLWLPREDQLRDALGQSLVALEHEGNEWIVTYKSSDRLARLRDGDVECGYARALVAVLGDDTTS